MFRIYIVHETWFHFGVTGTSFTVTHKKSVFFSYWKFKLVKVILHYNWMCVWIYLCVLILLPFFWPRMPAGRHFGDNPSALVSLPIGSLGSIEDLVSGNVGWASLAICHDWKPVTLQPRRDPRSARLGSGRLYLRSGPDLKFYVIVVPNASSKIADDELWTASLAQPYSWSEPSTARFRHWTHYLALSPEILRVNDLIVNEIET